MIKLQRSILILATFNCLVLKLLAQSELVSLESPIKSANDDRVALLPDLGKLEEFKSSEQYSGYLAADDLSDGRTSKFIHYWLFASQSAKTFENNNDPIIVWTGGKPGCSSMLSLLREIGPFGLKSDGKLVVNSYSWNENYNLLFLDGPSVVGFSYDYENHVSDLLNDKDEDLVALENGFALLSFFKKFPQLEQNPIYLASEKYSGIHLPILSSNLLRKNFTLNLKGLILGNPLFDARLTQEAAIYLSYHHGLIDSFNWKDISDFCCDGKVPARGQCHFQASSQKCSMSLQKVTNVLSGEYPGLNPENLYNYCANYLIEDSKDKLPALCSLESRRLSTKTGRDDNEEEEGGDEDEVYIKEHGALANYLNREDVRRAIHIPERLERPFESCNKKFNNTLSYKYPYMKHGMSPQIKELLDYKERKLHMLVYNGDVDLTHNFMGNKWFIEDLKRPVVAPHTPWYCNDRLAGFVIRYDRLVFATINGAGAAPTFDRPKETRMLLDEFVQKTKGV